jgi:hypothetical protein
VQCNAAGQVVLKLKTPWRDGTTHPVVSALKFMQRPAALVQRPRLALPSAHFSPLKDSFRAPSRETCGTTGRERLIADFESGCSTRVSPWPASSPPE